MEEEGREGEGRERRRKSCKLSIRQAVLYNNLLPTTYNKLVTMEATPKHPVHVILGRVVLTFMCKASQTHSGR